MKKISYIAILILFAFSINAQQVGMYNHYFYKPLFYNPAFSGSGESMEAMMINRSQWTSFNNGPQLNIFTIDGAIKEKKAGVGLTLVSDKRGINKRNGGLLSYAYRANINDDTYILLGLGLGLVNQTIDYSKAISETGSDPTLFYTQQQKTTFDGNAGLAFIWKGLEVAASAPQLLGNKINYVDDTSGIRSYYTHSRHFMTSLKYKFILSEEMGISLAPQALLRIVPGTPLQYDGNINLDWKNKCWVGATYKSNYAVSVNAGVCVYKQLNIGYSYEVITGNISKYSGISHELMINFKFGRSKKSDEVDTAYIAQQAKNEMYVNKMDSLNTELTENQKVAQENQKKINELTTKLEQMKAQQEAMQKIQNQQATNQYNGNIPTTNNSVNPNATTNPNGTQNNAVNTAPNNSNQNNSTISNSPNKYKENNIWIVKNEAKGYTSAAKKAVKAGFYVVVGTFYYEDFAMDEVKRFKKSGYTESGVVFSNSEQLNYVYIKRYPSKEEALKAAANLQKSKVPDAWVKVLE